MEDSVPPETIQAFARSICSEAAKYGFEQVDILRLINAMMDISSDATIQNHSQQSSSSRAIGKMQISKFPLSSTRLHIRQADVSRDLELLEGWMSDRYGRYFLLSCATAQSMELTTMLENPSNAVGIVLDAKNEPIGSVAFLDIDNRQKRAELRKLIGVPEARGQGYAEEATRLWIEYGGRVLGLEKIYVSSLQTHLNNIRLNESIGFKVEGLLQREVLISGERHDVLRMGLCFNDLISPENQSQ